jgi:hypothetical protein
MLKEARMEGSINIATVALLAILVSGFYVFVIRRKPTEP